MDRDAQFRYINDLAVSELRAHRPVIAVDTKQALVGHHKHAGRALPPKGPSRNVPAGDVRKSGIPKDFPYAVYGREQNKGWVNVGMSADTAGFAVESIRQWWRHMGKPRYRLARRLLICADSGGTSGSRLQHWKGELQTFANETGLTITVCHLPPGTSKWNAIEPRLFAFISMRRQGRSRVDFRTVVNLVAAGGAMMDPVARA